MFDFKVVWELLQMMIEQRIVEFDCCAMMEGNQIDRTVPLIESVNIFNNYCLSTNFKNS